jgi:hypothetical protein
MSSDPVFSRTSNRYDLNLRMTTAPCNQILNHFDIIAMEIRLGTMCTPHKIKDYGWLKFVQNTKDGIMIACIKPTSRVNTSRRGPTSSW